MQISRRKGASRGRQEKEAIVTVYVLSCFGMVLLYIGVMCSGMCVVCTAVYCCVLLFTIGFVLIG